MGIALVGVGPRRARHLHEVLDDGSVVRATRNYVDHFLRPPWLGPFARLIEIGEARERFRRDERLRIAEQERLDREFAAMAKRLEVRFRVSTGWRSFEIFHEGQTAASWLVDLRGGASEVIDAREDALDRIHAAQRRLLLEPTAANAELLATAYRTYRRP